MTLTMKDLPGWRGTRKAYIFKSTVEAMRLVRAGKVAMAAGHDGAINAYRARDRRYRGQFMQYCSVVDSIVCATPKELREWLALNVRKIGDRDRLAWQ